MTDLDQPAPRRRLLPLLGSHGGGRSAMTCVYRCANACAHPAPNTSDNAYFGDVVAEGMSRRGLLRAGAAAGLVVSFGGTAAATAPAAVAGTSTGPVPGDFPVSDEGALTFTPIAPNTVDTVIVPNGYDWSVLMAWGDKVEPGAPAFDIDDQSAEAQARQFGYNCDYVALLPLDKLVGGRRSLLVVNHEYTNEELMFPGWLEAGGAAGATLEQLRIAMAAHGMSVVEVERVGDTGEWRPAGGRTYNRRLTAMTPFRLTGPAAGHPLMRTSADPSGTTVLGTLNNCAGGLTPWGTVLSGEENFNGYFKAPAATPPGQFDSYGNDAYARYTIGSAPDSPFWRNWESVDPRFDPEQEPNEPNRFGWVVELDPYTRRSVPKKRTALGRFKHEGATIRISDDGHAVAYMGDDERYEYVYKFVSKKTYIDDISWTARQHNMTLLDEGDLYVARFTGDSPASEIDGSGTLPSDGAFDGTGTWLPLVKDGHSMVPGYTVEEVLIWTRLAADALGRDDAADGPTKMDRPEDIEPNPVTGRVYCALTNNTRRTPAEVNEANPRPENRHGHVLELTEHGDDPVATTFDWMLFIVAGDPEAPDTYFAGYDKSEVSPISSPDNVAFDPAGNLWIATDGNSLGSHDGLFAVATEGEERGHLKQFLTVPTGAECCGPVVTLDQRTALVAVQHPGEADGSTFEDPASTFPYGHKPRPSVVSIWRKAPGSNRIGA